MKLLTSVICLSYACLFAWASDQRAAPDFCPAAPYQNIQMVQQLQYPPYLCMQPILQTVYGYPPVMVYSYYNPYFCPYPSPAAYPNHNAFMQTSGPIFGPILIPQQIPDPNDNMQGVEDLIKYPAAPLENKDLDAKTTQAEYAESMVPLVAAEVKNSEIVYKEKKVTNPKKKSSKKMQTGKQSSIAIPPPKQDDVVQSVPKAVNIPKKALLNYILEFLSPDDYPKVTSGIDPRDIAHAYLLVGERAYTNILFQYAAHLSKELRGMLASDVAVFEREMRVEAVRDPEQFLESLQVVMAGISIDDFFAAIDIYKKRLRFAHPRQVSDKSVSQMKPYLKAHLRVFHGTPPESGFGIRAPIKTEVIKRTGISGRDAVYHTKPFSGFNSYRPSTLAKPDVIDVTLAILYIMDYHYTPNLEYLRQKCAHSQGAEGLYAATVEYVFADHPYREFYRSLKL